jgi:RimJ/RimL family protein N-acetyltransferase
MGSIPTLITDRLLLRAPDASDFPLYRDFYADEQASIFYGGPISGAQAWRRLAQDIGHWALRGHGMWTIVEISSGLAVGGCGIVHPEGWPRHELSWWIMPAARRQGYALEGSRAAVRWALTALAWPAVETHMKDDNLPARSLVTKLGGKLIAREAFPDMIVRDVFAIPAS